jgi:hypothetical protein
VLPQKEIVMFAPKKAPLVFSFDPKTQWLDSHEKLGI